MKIKLDENFGPAQGGVSRPAPNNLSMNNDGPLE